MKIKYFQSVSTFCIALLIQPTFGICQTPLSNVAIGDLKLPQELSSQQVRLRSAVLNAFAKQKNLKVVPRSEIEQFRDSIGLGTKTRSDSEELKEIRELLARGKSAYTALKFQSAISFLEEARRSLILKLQLLRSNRDLIDAHLYLGLSYAAAHQNERAAEEFQKLIYLDPSRELSSHDYSPQVISLFSKVRKEILSEDPVRLRIESNPPGGNIYLNGKLTGTAPTELKLQPGEYFILIEKTGLQPWFKPVKLKKLLETVSVSLKSSNSDLQWGELLGVKEGEKLKDEQDIEALGALGQQTNAQIVFLGEVQKEPQMKLLGQLFDARTKDFSKVVAVDLDDISNEFSQDANTMVEKLVSLIRPDGYVVTAQANNLSYAPADLLVGGQTTASQAGIVSAPSEKKKWFEEWWVWGALAVIGAGAIWGGIALSQSNQSGQIVIHNQGNF